MKGTRASTRHRRKNAINLTPYLMAWANLFTSMENYKELFVISLSFIINKVEKAVHVGP
jgi:hypothetical protein